MWTLTNNEVSTPVNMWIVYPAKEVLALRDLTTLFVCLNLTKRHRCFKLDLVHRTGREPCHVVEGLALQPATAKEYLARKKGTWPNCPNYKTKMATGPNIIKCQKCVLLVQHGDNGTISRWHQNIQVESKQGRLFYVRPWGDMFYLWSFTSQACIFNHVWFPNTTFF